MKTKIATNFFFILLSISCFSQSKTKILLQTIRGVVIDATTKAPLPFSSVGVLDVPEAGTATDSLGYFIIKKVPIGRQSIKASSVGYISHTISEILITSSKEVYLEIQLQENAQMLDEVVISSRSNNDEPLNKMALSGARMLSVEQASRYAGGLDDPARFVSAFAGVASSASSNGISIHGNAPHLLQWRLEDIEIPNPNHFADIATLGGGILSSLSNKVLGNSDFFTSAFPAEYGNAVSGVFDMKFRNGNNQKNEHTLQIGVLGLEFASEGPISKKHNSSYLINYRYSTTGLMSKFMSDDLGGVFDYQDLNFKLNFPTPKAGIFSVWGTALIDVFKSEFEKDTEKWEFLYDRTKSKDRQYMAAGGLTHRYFFNDNTFLKTTLASSFSKFSAKVDMYNFDLNKTPFGDLYNQNKNLITSITLNKKFSSRFTNKTGVTIQKMFFEMDLKKAPHEGKPLTTMSQGKGDTELISAFSSSSFDISNNVISNFGLYSQYLTLNGKWVLEPRFALKWQKSPKISWALAYGMHSRMERMDVYYVRGSDSDKKIMNKNLDFTKTHHLMLTYNYKIGDDMNLRIEPYFQYLHDVPVIVDSSYCVLNRDEFYVEEALVNKGRGRNFGIDITFEKYLNRGYYYMLSGSVFDSRYRGGDGKWYNTKFNRNFILNVLGGKEWLVGKNKNRIWSVNLRCVFQGGDRFSPIDTNATLLDPDKNVQYDETRAYSKQFNPIFMFHYTVSYRINRKNKSHEFAIKALNAAGSKEYYGHVYNYKTGKIESDKQEMGIGNISYKFEF